MIPELKEAIIKFMPEYFSWDIDQQERYRVNMPGELSFRIRSFLISKLLGVTVTTEDEIGEIEDHFSEAQWVTINAALLPIQGVGEDYFFLNESFAEGESVLSYVTLYEYDFSDYQFQERWRLNDIEGYKGNPYHGSLHWNWARLQIDGKFSYALLSMVANYIQSEVDAFGNGYVQQLIPYEFRPGKHHGRKVEAGLYCYDMVENAGGLESQLNELKHRFWSYLQELLGRLQVEFSEKSMEQVYIVNTSRDDVPEHHFIFSDSAVLSDINLKTFMDSCLKVEQKDHSILMNRVEEEKKLLRHYLDEQLANILD